MVRAGDTLALEHNGEHRILSREQVKERSQDKIRKLVGLGQIIEMMKAAPQAILNSKGSQGEI